MANSGFTNIESFLEHYEACFDRDWDKFKTVYCLARSTHYGAGWCSIEDNPALQGCCYLLEQTVNEEIHDV